MGIKGFEIIIFVYEKELVRQKCQESRVALEFAIFLPKNKY